LLPANGPSSSAIGPTPVALRRQILVSLGHGHDL
jgi:hypothetical protein